MAGYYAVCECGSVDCSGGCGPEEPIDAELESLAETPEGLGWERMEEVVPAGIRLAEVVRQIQEDERAKAERMRYAA